MMERMQGPAGREGGTPLEAAMALHRDGLTAEAEAAYRALLRASPDDTDALHLLGVAVHQQGRSEEGLALIDRALALRHFFPEAWDHLGMIRLTLGDRAGAEAAHRQAVRQNPGAPKPMTNLAQALRQLDRMDEAEALLRRVLSMHPDEVPALLDLGDLLRLLGRAAEAEPLLRRALKAEPESAPAWVGLGTVLQALCRAEEAEAAYDRAATLDPDLAVARWDRSLLRLARGDLAGGWSDYEARFDGGPVLPKRRFAIPRWRGEDISGRTLLVWREQGLGDAIMFGGLLAEAIDRAGHVIIETDARLVPLLARSWPRATVRRETDDPTDVDLEIPVGSLPGLFRRRLGDFGAGPWLKPDPVRAAEFAKRLRDLGPGLKVGLCWTSGLQALERDGNYTELLDWAALAAIPGVTLVNLQYSDSAEELRVAAARGVTLAGWPDLDLRNDVDGMAALISGLDLVVTAPTSVGEISAALGVPTWRVGMPGDWSHLGTPVRPWFPAMRAFLSDESVRATPPLVVHALCHLAGLEPPTVAAAPPMAATPRARTSLQNALTAVPAKASPVTPPEPKPAKPALSLPQAFALHEQGRTAEAEAAYRSLIAWKQDDADALHLLGLLRFQAGDGAEAAHLIGRAVEARPGFATAENNLANILQAAGRLAEAERHYRAALAAKPDFVEAWSNLGTVLQGLGRLDQAEEALRTAIEHRPGHAEAWTNLGSVLKELGRAAEAETCHRRALGLAPGMAMAHTNLGSALRVLGRGEEAEAALARALEIEPGQPLARFNRALLRLEAGDLAGGWPGYEDRFVAKRDQPARRLPMPRWRGEDVSGRRVLVWREQGLGDELMFGSLYRDLQARCGHLVVECDPRLVGIIARALPGATVRAETRAPRDADVEVPAGSLPGLLRPRTVSFDGRPWLTPDPALAGHWAERLGALGPGLKVGICWRSGLRSAEREGLYSRLEEWAPLFRLPGISWVSLQYDSVAAEPELAAAEARHGITIARWPDLDLADDLDGVAALVAGLDLVVTAATAVSEMAGALGVPCWRFGRGPDWTALGTGVRPWFASQRSLTLAEGSRPAEALATFARDLARLAQAPAAPAEPPPADALETAIEHHKAGRAGEAERLYRLVLAAEPDQPVALHLLGHLLAGDGRAAEGIPLMRRAVALVPDFVAALSNLAAALLRQGEAEEALARYEVARRLRPTSAGIATGLGTALARLGRHAEAEAAHRSALAIDPGLAEVHANLGETLVALGRLDEAEACHTRATALKPGWAGGWNNLGLLLTARERVDEAEACFRRVLELEPGHAGALTNLGALRRLQGRHGEGEAIQRALVERSPDDPDALINLGIVLRDQRRLPESTELFERALARRPGDAKAVWNLGLNDLTLGRLDRGWARYEARSQAIPHDSYRAADLPRWRGEDISGRRLLVRREQGLGDELMFSALYADLRARCGHLVVECDKRLVGLFARALPGATVRAETADARDADVFVPAGSLPGLLCPDLAGFPARAGWLGPDPDLAARWSERLAGLGPGLRVGICWRSGLKSLERRGLYVELADMAPLLRLPGIVPVSLQYDMPEDETSAAEAALGVTLHRWPDLDLRNDLEGAAALTSHLDLVVSAATAVGEMAGALGVPVWRLEPAADWSSLGTAARPWFPAMRVWTPAAGEPLGTVCAAMARELRRLAAGAAPLPDRQPAPQPSAPPAAAANLETAVALHRAGRLDEAELAYRAALTASPGDPDALHLMGLLLHQRGEHGRALALVERALAADPAFAQAHNSAGSALRELGRPDEAEAAFRRASDLNPSYAEAWTNLGAVLADRRRPAEAIEAHGRALAIRPDYAKARINLGIALRHAGRPAEAVAELRHALDLDPGSAVGWTNLGLALADLGHESEAATCHAKAVKLDPSFAEARNNLAILQVGAGDRAGARATLDRLLADQPGFAPALYNRALLALEEGDLARGWDWHEARFAARQAEPDRHFTMPRWRGEDVPARRVLVWREQGLGDELMFGSLYRDLQARCGHLVVECDPRLVGLLSRALPQATVRAETADPRDADLEVPAGSLPRALAPVPGAFRGTAYLEPRADLAALWRERLAALGPGLKIGICWRSQVRTVSREKSYTRLDDWAPLFALPGIDWVSLQYDGGGEEIAAAEARFGIRIARWHDADLRDDLETAAALTSGLDLVITAATAVGEMAGALGVPVWRFTGAGDWSCLGTAVRPWFASMRVFRAGNGERAADTLPRIAITLRALLAADPAPGGPGGGTGEGPGGDPAEGNTEALLERAVGHHRDGRLEAAADGYGQVLRRDPSQPVALHLLGLARGQTGRRREAIELMERAVAAAPTYAAALVNLGNALQEAGRPAEAEARYRQALAARPDAADALTNLGNALRTLGRLEEAAESHHAALALDPGLAAAHANLAAALKDLDRPEDAAASYRAALSGGLGTDLEEADALTGLGDALRLLGRAAEGEALHRRAIALVPGHAEAHNNLARTLEAADRTEAALAAYNRALDLDPGLASARLNRGLLDLAAGRLEAGWEGYGWRFDAETKHPRRRFGIGEWHGEDVSDKRLLVWREQGLGDELLFGALYGGLAARAGTLVIECDRRLTGLFARAFPTAEVRAEQEGTGGAELQVAAGSLARLLPWSAARAPVDGYLAAEPGLKALWARRLADLGPGLKVGLCWRSRTLTTERRAAYSTLDQWAPLLALPGISWVNLQYDGGAAELVAAEAAHGIRVARWDGVDLMDDLETAAALTAGLDLVISPATSVSEMAGALGVPCWRFAHADWTGLGTAVRPWFPSQRQFPLAEGVPAALARMAGELAALRG
ncbi:MAG TPA: tetratricopeptide repeat protein [Azospirillaceae bacterium]|nr:tetratricopeptide repeat protein [Azospirillaceae bacterium]